MINDAIIQRILKKFHAEEETLVARAQGVKTRWYSEAQNMRNAQYMLAHYLQKTEAWMHGAVARQQGVSFLKTYFRFLIFPLLFFSALPLWLYIVVACLILAYFCGFDEKTIRFFYADDGTFEYGAYHTACLWVSLYSFVIAPILAFFLWRRQHKNAVSLLDTMASGFRSAALVYVTRDSRCYGITLDNDDMHWVYPIEYQDDMMSEIRKKSPNAMGIIFFHADAPETLLAAYALEEDKLTYVAHNAKVNLFIKYRDNCADLATPEQLRYWKNAHNYLVAAADYFALKNDNTALLQKSATLQIQSAVWSEIYAHPEQKSEAVSYFSCVPKSDLSTLRTLFLVGGEGSGREYFSTILATSLNLTFATVDATLFQSVDTLKKGWESIRNAPPSIIFIPDADVLFEKDAHADTLQMWLRLLEIDHQNGREIALIFGMEDPTRINPSVARTLKVKTLQMRGLDPDSVLRYFNDTAVKIKLDKRVPQEYVSFFVGSCYGECKKFMNAVSELYAKHHEITKPLWEMALQKVRHGGMYGYEEAMHAVENMVGLTAVKSELRLLINQAQMKQKYKDQLLDFSGAHHLVFAGNPGTGKTTVAKYLAAIYHHWGVIRKNLCIECTRKDLVGDHVGETATKTAAKIAEAIGGILFIDEAYSLLDENVGYGREAITEILSAMESHRDDLIVIIAGYENEMNDFIKSNPGFESRFKRRIHFEDFNADELFLIFKSFLQTTRRILTPDAETTLQGCIHTLYARRSTTFGNAREIRKLFEDCVSVQQNRLFAQGAVSDTDLVTITREDVLNACADVAVSEADVATALSEMEALVGLPQMKAQIKKMLATAKLREQQIHAGKNPPAIAWNMLFSGNPGTGKTTVARLMGRIFKAMNLLPSDHVEEVRADQLIASYTGQSASKTATVIQRAIGGILFIDEAYLLAENDYGKEVAGQLLSAMEDHRSDLVVILAGYTDAMRKFFDLNPGLDSRVPAQNRILFEDYTPAELLAIFDAMLKHQSLKLLPEAEADIARFLKQAAAKDNFGNAREVRNLVDAAVIECASRATDTITVDIARQITHFAPPKSPVDTLESAIEELRELIGLNDVKAIVQQWVSMMRFNALQAEKGIAPAEQSYHMIFSGAPGTGKTTVARILGKIFKALGVLKTDHVIEVDRAGLVAGYAGQTALKTTEVLRSALDGILFIDEAYSLLGDEHDTYGLEAIQTLLKFMEDHRSRIVVVAAGYTSEMNRFLDANSGLRSRFNKILHFQDYTPDELLQILMRYMTQQALSFDANAPQIILSHFDEILQNPPRDFSNGRTARNLFDAILRAHAGHMDTPGFMPSVITQNDVESVIKTTHTQPQAPLLKIDTTPPTHLEPDLPQTLRAEIKMTAPDTFAFTCPVCRTISEIPADLLECKLQCPKCLSKMVVHNDFTLTLLTKEGA